MGQHYLNIVFNEQSGPESVSQTKCQFEQLRLYSSLFEVPSIKLEEN